MRRRFFIQNFIFVALPVVLVVLLMGGMAIYITVTGTKRDIESANEQTISKVSDSIGLMFSESDAQSLNYSVSPYVVLRLENLLQNGYADKYSLDVSYMIKTFVDSNVNSKPYLHSVYIYLKNSKGNFFASSAGLANSSNFRDISWMQQIDGGPADKNQWLEVRNVGTYAMSTYSTNIISLYKKLYSSERKNPIGLLVMNLRQEYMNSFLSGYLSYPGQSIFLLNSDGSVLCSAGEISPPAVPLHLEELKKHYFVSVKQNEGYGVTYCSLIPYDVLAEQAKGMLKMVIVAIVISLLSGCTLTYLVTQRDAQELGVVIQLLSSAERGEELPIVDMPNDAYGYIMQNIIKTFLEKNNLDKQLLEKKYKLESMQFSFLQSQLNPHFLFNTFKNIFWKTVKLTGGPNDASRMIDLLTGVLHYTLVNPGKYVTVAEEIENTKKYIKIQQMRFDYGFAVDWVTKGDLQKEKCIKFLLQPLIENSISHGFGEREGGWLAVHIEDENDRLYFSVADNGQGFSPERLEEIKHRLEQEDSPVESIGLYNLNKRLVLAYGPDCALSIQSVPDTETKISFSIPMLP